MSPLFLLLKTKLTCFLRTEFLLYFIFDRSTNKAYLQDTSGVLETGYASEGYSPAVVESVVPVFKSVMHALSL